MIDIDRAASEGRVLELGAGESPHRHTDVTVDIRGDLPAIDHPDVDIGSDRLPVDELPFDVVLMFH